MDGSNKTTRRPLVKVKVVREGAITPKQWTAKSVGIDLHAHIISESSRRNTILIPPRTTRPVPTGLAIEVEDGFWTAVCTRSGLAKERSIFIVNAPGIIDPDFRGEIFVLLYNGGHESYWVKHEDRVGQLVLFPTIFPSVLVVKELSKTDRGESGLGSTGR